MTLDEAHQHIRTIFRARPEAALTGPLISSLIAGLLVKGVLTPEDLQAIAEDSAKQA